MVAPKGACVVALGGAWFFRGMSFFLGGMHGFFQGVGGVHGFSRETCVVFSGGCAWFFTRGHGHVWFFLGGVHVFPGGACMVFPQVGPCV